MGKRTVFSFLFGIKCVLSVAILLNYFLEINVLAFVPLMAGVIISDIADIVKHIKNRSHGISCCNSIIGYIVFIISKFLFADILYSFSAGLFNYIVPAAVVIVNIIAGIVTVALIRLILQCNSKETKTAYYRLVLPHVIIPYEYYIYFVCLAFRF